MPIASENKSWTRNGMANGSEMSTTGNGNVNSGDIWVPNTVAYCLATLTRSGGTMPMQWDDSHFDIVLSARKALNIAARALSRLCF